MSGKARSDSLWSRLDPEVREEVFTKLLQEGDGYKETSAWLKKEHGISASSTALCDMVAKRGLTWRYTASRASAERVLGLPGMKAAIDDGRLSEETRKLLAVRLASVAAEQMSINEILAVRKITLEEDALRVKTRAQDLAEDRWRHVAAGDILAALRKDPEVLRALGEIAGDVRMTEVDKIAAIRARMWA